MLTVGAEDIAAACYRVGIGGAPVCVHAALHTFGWVGGGGATVIQGLLAAECTVIVPSFSWGAYAIAPPAHLRPPRNGWSYGALTRRTLLGMQHTRIFTPASSAIDPEMGAVPAAVIEMPGRVRGNHALASFSGMGEQAATLIGGQHAEDVFAPLAGLAAAGGYVALMGVGLNRMTLLHLAEKRAGRTLFRRWAYDGEGEPAMFEVGGCSEGFPQLEKVLADCEMRVTVGRSIWRVFSAQDVLDLATAQIQAQPESTRCDDPLCARCRDMIAGGPQLD